MIIYNEENFDNIEQSDLFMMVSNGTWIWHCMSQNIASKKDVASNINFNDFVIFYWAFDLVGQGSRPTAGSLTWYSKIDLQLYLKFKPLKLRKITVVSVVPTWKKGLNWSYNSRRTIFTFYKVVKCMWRFSFFRLVLTVYVDIDMPYFDRWSQCTLITQVCDNDYWMGLERVLHHLLCLTFDKFTEFTIKHKQMRQHILLI